MASGSVIELESLLAPIAGANPSGRSLVYEPEYDALREARRSEDATHQGDWAREVKVASWDQVVALGSTCLAAKTKDLQIAAWIAEALGRQHGFAGLREGFRLLRELLDRFWDTLYPAIEDGDLEPRATPFEFLGQDKVLPLVIRETPLTAGLREQNYSFLRWQESRTVDNIGKRDPEQLQILLDEGKITGEQFDEAVRQTPRAFYEALNNDLEGAWEAYRELDAALDQHFGSDAPSLSAIRKALEDVRRVLVPILATKRAEEPDEEEPMVEEPDAEEPMAEAEVEPEPPGLVGTEAAPAQARSKAPARPVGGPIASPEDAIDRILDAAAYLRQHEPGSPLSFAVVRALRLAELYSLGHPPDPSGLVSPASETRQALKRLAAEGDPEALLEAAEQALGRPEGRAWLDAHRYALSAMAASTAADRSAAAAACRALLRAVLADFPELPHAELADDTPTASAETRAWLVAEVLPPPTAPAPEPEPILPTPEPVSHSEAVAGGGEDRAEPEPDPWELALADVRAGNASEGLRRLRAAMARATSGREKFRRKLQMAELCLAVGNHRVALPLLDELARQIDEFHLEQWEDEALCARVWGALYRALRASGAAAGDDGRADRLQEAYTRLCRLDIHQALSCDGG